MGVTGWCGDGVGDGTGVSGGEDVITSTLGDIASSSVSVGWGKRVMGNDFG